MYPGLQRQGGQSTVEFAVLALALVPLFLVVALLGKYIDLYQTAEAASRYLAFEGAARNSSNSWKTDAELGVEVRRRFFSNSDASVKTGDAAGDFAAHRNPIWSDASGKPLIDKFEDKVSVATQVNARNAIAAASVYAGQLNLSIDNQYTASVTVKPNDVAGLKPFDTIGLELSRKTVLLTDAWTARDPATIRARIEGSALMYPISAVKALIDPVGQVPTLLFDPALRVGNFDWDVVPCDRLIGGC
jgi:Flp pilus assembly protein TadG